MLNVRPSHNINSHQTFHEWMNYKRKRMFEHKTLFMDSGFVGVLGEMEVGRGTKREAAEVEDLKLVVLAGTVVEMAGKGRAK